MVSSACGRSATRNIPSSSPADANTGIRKRGCATRATSQPDPHPPERHPEMRTRLISVGERMPAWVADGFAEYRKRLSRELPLDLVEIPLGNRGKSRDPLRATASEGQSV